MTATSASWLACSPTILSTSPIRNAASLPSSVPWTSSDKHIGSQEDAESLDLPPAMPSQRVQHQWYLPRTSSKSDHRRIVIGLEEGLEGLCQSRTRALLAQCVGVEPCEHARATKDAASDARDAQIARQSPSGDACCTARCQRSPASLPSPLPWCGGKLLL